MSETNIGYWEQVLRAPTSAYKKLFEAEKEYLHERIKADMKVLDIGCGDGRNMRSILEKTKFVTGVDNDQKAVEGTRKHFSEAPTVKVVLGDASALPFEDGSFDIVTLLMILVNLDKQKVKALTEAARVLKKDGLIILSTFAETAFDERMEIYTQIKASIERVEDTKVIFNKSLVSEQFSLTEIEKLAKEAGLKILETEKVGNLSYICTLSKSGI